MKCVLWAWGELKRGFEVFALCGICFEGMGKLKRGSQVVALGEIRFDGMRAVEKGV